MSKVLLKNIGTLVSGDIEKPILQADAIWIEEGLIKKVGFLKDMDEKAADTVIDCAGTTVTPGLFDSHVHPVLGDFTPRQKQIDFLESEVHGGVTTSISAGEVHLPGRPKDPAGTKALAILSAKSFAGFRPGGMKVLGGAMILGERSCGERLSRNAPKKECASWAKSGWVLSSRRRMRRPW